MKTNINPVNTNQGSTLAKPWIWKIRWMFLD